MKIEAQGEEVERHFLPIPSNKVGFEAFVAGNELINDISNVISFSK